ncbi:uncharacterized protein BDZ83DRAFT_613952 [Colletotrichum acutatum]|uniref:Uncharacterized protein n=1 Tax=Glomerella acutata TaxID=27357 RepID=A0AAD8XH40_GLOAC|nr:uncharacterized protein BDZ83DRAFT_613952 [Colletotrichum acutatum]KAK1727017.1 hypothetical protein BDZ83DRAFT_613952 [Colletotrichum acutatum]
MFRYLAYDPFLFPSEANTQYELGDSLNKKQKETLEIITACHLYKSFMNAKKRTCRLLINAREDYDTLGAARHLAAKIMANPGFIREPSTIVIGWFCDIQGLVEYKDPSKPCHSRGMMAGLVCQLLDEMMGRNINCDLSFIRHAKWADIKSFNLQRLIKVFVTLMNQLPKESQVICVLDEIYHYVNWDARHDAFNAIRGLVALTEGKKLSADRYFKLVLTCRQEPLGVRRWFKDEGKIIDVKYRRKPRR